MFVCVCVLFTFAAFPQIGIIQSADMNKPNERMCESKTNISKYIGCSVEYQARTRINWNYNLNNTRIVFLLIVALLRGNYANGWR